jgi:tRNA threonylcarbamoyladenosine biosynthesis protein TsaE
LKTELVYHAYSALSCIDLVLDKVFSYLKNTPILLLKGNLGAGKTTLAQELIKRLGVNAEVNSPTFNIVNTYKDAEGKEVYHFDLYRLKHAEELDEIGFYEYIDSNRPCLIEWPEIAEESLDLSHLELQIEHEPEGRSYKLYLISEDN